MKLSSYRLDSKALDRLGVGPANRSFPRGVTDGRPPRGLARFRLLGLGTALPENVLTNEALSAQLGITPEAILAKTGIHSRHVAGADDTTSSLASRASRLALDRAGIRPQDVELLILSTYTPDHALCPTAPAVATAIGARGAGAFDVNGACTGGVTALLAGASLLGRPFRRVLVVASDLTTRFLRKDDVKTRLLFGDGAAALVLEHAEEPDEGAWLIASAEVGSDGSGSAHFRVPSGHSHVHMDGPEIFRFAVGQGRKLAIGLCRSAGVTLDEVSWVVPHQANRRIIDALSEHVGIPRSQWFTNIDHLGNTASGSVLIALDDLLQKHPVESGDRLMLLGFGAGLTWSGLLLQAP